MEILDVTNEYLENTTPGTIKYEPGYSIKLHKDEITTAKWLVQRFGGNITLLRELPNYSKITPDFEWNGSFWELKSLSSKKAIDSAIRKALNQIRENPGGIILNIPGTVKTSSIESTVLERVKRSKIKHVDVLFLNDKSLIKAVKYKR